MTVTGLLGRSPAMAALRDYLPKVARSVATVLVTGETGTGKERVAESLHRLGPRAGRPFVPINCAALPEALIESELFGHARGAFTGATETRPGALVEADGGTLFLDEIGEMPLVAQAKLLRALEARAVRRVGGGPPRAVDARIVAATNQPLEELVARGRFRADLFYRLNVARLELPPLRERTEDVPELWAATVAEFNRRDGAHVGGPAPDLMGCLLAHNWPGNVRELRKLAEVLFIDPPEGAVCLAHLPPTFRRIFSRYCVTGSEERDRLVAALAATEWNKAEAAKALNWSRMTLYRKLAHYRIERD